jgi:hypothetical protein
MNQKNKRNIMLELLPEEVKASEVISKYGKPEKQVTQ